MIVFQTSLVIEKSTGHSGPLPVKAMGPLTAEGLLSVGRGSRQEWVGGKETCETQVELGLEPQLQHTTQV